MTLSFLNGASRNLETVKLSACLCWGCSLDHDRLQPRIGEIRVNSKLVAAHVSLLPKVQVEIEPVPAPPMPDFFNYTPGLGAYQSNRISNPFCMQSACMQTHAS